MSAPLRVGINLLWLRPGVVGGSEVAAVGTVDALSARDPAELSLRIYAQSSFVAAHPDVGRRVSTRTVNVPGGARGTRVALEATWLPVQVSRDEVEVLHCYGGVVPPGLRVPTVLTLHDVQPLEADAAFSPVKRTWLRTMIPRSVARADAVVVPSEFVRDRLLSLVDVDAGKVEVIPHGDGGPGARHDGETLTEPEVRRRFRLDGPYVLYPAITYPHKNHRVLIEALAECARVGPAPVLVLTGSAGPSEVEVAALIEERGLARLVRRVGRVSGREIVALERHAALVAFPSSYEGFGLPILEAFAQGTPVAASNAASLPEVVGDVGELVGPDDVDCWADVLRRATREDFDSDEAAARRRERARNYHWTGIVDSLIDLYGRVGRADRRHE